MGNTIYKRKPSKVIPLSLDLSSIRALPSEHSSSLVFSPVSSELTFRINTRDYENDHKNQIHDITMRMREFGVMNDTDMKFIEKNTTVSEKVAILRIFNSVTKALIEVVKEDAPRIVAL